MSTALAFLRPVKNGSFLPPNCQESFGFLLRLLIRFEFSSRMLQRSTAFGLSLPRNNWQPFTPQKFSAKSSQIHTILRRFFFLQSCALWFVKMPTVTCCELKLLRNEIDKWILLPKLINIFGSQKASLSNMRYNKQLNRKRKLSADEYGWPIPRDPAGFEYSLWDWIPRDLQCGIPQE